MEDTKSTEIPDVIVQFSTGDMYRKGQFLGKGFFAKCYLITNLKNNTNYAAKIVTRSHASYSKSVLKEVSLHGKLNHKNVVKLQGFFEDCHFGYILMEVCNRGCMLGLLKNRIILTEPEVRYYMKQILNGIVYLHRRLIIHRDLKLGNLLLTSDLKVKIGDFGTAVQSSKGEIHQGMCGTPNYIAPEVVAGRGHSFKFDIFSTGCILYTLLLGLPPFQDSTRERVFKRVEFGQYCLPTEKPSQEAKYLIRSMLQLLPNNRPTALCCLSSQFMKGFAPAKLPLTSVTEPPELEDVQQEGKSGYYLRKPLKDVNRKVPLKLPAVVKCDTKPTRRSPRYREVGLQRSDNIANEPSSRKTAEPLYIEAVRSGDVSDDPFDTSEMSLARSTVRGVDKSDPFGQHINCKQVEGKAEELLSVASNSCRWLDAENLDHKTKLMNRLCGIPSSNGLVTNSDSNKTPRGQKSVLGNRVEAGTVAANGNKMAACNGNSCESPGSGRCEPTGAVPTSDSVASHERRTVETSTLEKAKRRVRLQNVIGLNTHSGMEGTVKTNREATGCRTNLKPSLVPIKESDHSHQGENGLVQTETSSSSNQTRGTSYVESAESKRTSTLSEGMRVDSGNQIEDLLLSIYTHLLLVINANRGKRTSQKFQAARLVNATPTVVRVLRWNDYTSKYGFGYQLSNGSVGMMFNDGTNVVLLLDGTTFSFVTRGGEVSWHKMGHYSDLADKKVRIVLEFKKSFEKLQEKAGETISLKAENGSTPYVITQYKDSATTIILLSNDTFQIDILNVNTKIVFCPGLTNVIFINADKQLQTLTLKSVLENACSLQLATSFKYAFNGVNKMIAIHDSTRTLLLSMKRKLEEEMGALKKLKTD